MRTIKGRQGQIIGQIFIYIMAALVIGALVLIGYWAVGTLMDKSCDVQRTNFNINLLSLTEKYNTYDSFHKEHLAAPCDYDKVCFVDSRAIGKAAVLRHCSNAIIKDSVRSNVTDNIFFISKQATNPIGYSEYVALEDNESCLCIPQKNSNFYIDFTGLGPLTKISLGG